MKFILRIDETQEPSVTVVCRKVNRAVEQIEKVCQEDCEEQVLYGYQGDEIMPLELADITCFYTHDNKVFASVGKDSYLTKLRIKQVLELVDDTFLKINQGCVANVKHIEKFSVSLGGALKITFKNGFTDYVARREVKQVKRRFGL